jgi:hypothetical protein
MRALTAVAVLGLGFAMAPDAHAAYVVTIVESGLNVVMTGSGTINLAGFHNPYPMSGEPPAALWPDVGTILIGAPGFQYTDDYVPFSGPASFGGGGSTITSIGTGDRVGVRQDPDRTAIVVPQGYVSGSHLSSSSTFDDATFASLGVTLGTYVWTWGTGATLDSFTLKITDEAPPVPEPGSLALLATGLVGLGLKWRRKAV